MQAADKKPGFVRKPTSQPKFGIDLAINSRAPQEPGEPPPSRKRPRSSHLKVKFNVADVLFPKGQEITSLEGLRVIRPIARIGAPVKPAHVPVGTEGTAALPPLTPRGATSGAENEDREFPIASTQSTNTALEQTPGSKRRAVENVDPEQQTHLSVESRVAQPVQLHGSQPGYDFDSDSDDGAEWRRHALNSAQRRLRKLQQAQCEAEKAAQQGGLQDEKGMVEGASSARLRGQQNHVPHPPTAFKTENRTAQQHAAQPKGTTRPSDKTAVKQPQIPASVRGRQFGVDPSPPFTTRQSPTHGAGLEAQQDTWQDYQAREVWTGAGFSNKLMDLTEEVKRFHYPTPSEALNAKRPNRRLRAFVQDVEIVGSMPPSLDESFLTMQQMKRAWLMKFNDREGNEAENERERAPPAAEPSGIAVFPPAPTVHSLHWSASDFFGGSPSFPPSSGPSTGSPQNASPRSAAHRNSATNPTLGSATFGSPDHFSFVLETLGAAGTATAVQSKRGDSSDPWSQNLEQDATAALALVKDGNSEIQVRRSVIGDVASPRTPWSNTVHLGLLGTENPDGNLKGTPRQASAVSTSRLSVGNRSPHRLVNSHRAQTTSPIAQATGNSPGRSPPCRPASPTTSQGAGDTGRVVAAAGRPGLEESGETKPNAQQQVTHFAVELRSAASAEHTPDMSAEDGGGTDREPDSRLMPVVAHKVIDVRGHERHPRQEKALREHARQPAPPRLGSDARRQAMMSQMRQKQEAGRGNKLLVKAKAEIARFDLAKARGSIDNAKEAFWKADAMDASKKALVEAVEEELRAAEERLQQAAMQDRTPTPPPTPRLAPIKVSLRGADRVQPDGMPASTREELARRQAAMAAEAREREEQERQMVETLRRHEEEVKARKLREEAEERERNKAEAAAVQKKKEEEAAERAAAEEEEARRREEQEREQEAEREREAERRRLEAEEAMEAERALEAKEAQAARAPGVLSQGSYELELFKSQDSAAQSSEMESHQRAEAIDVPGGVTGGADDGGFARTSSADLMASELRKEVEVLFEQKEQAAAEAAQRAEVEQLVKAIETEVFEEAARDVLQGAEDALVPQMVRDVVLRVWLHEQESVKEKDARLEREASVEEQKRVMEERRKKIEEEMAKLQAEEKQEEEQWRAQLELEDEKMRLEVEEEEEARRLQGERDEEELRRLALEALEKQERMGAKLLQASARRQHLRDAHCRAQAAALAAQAAARRRFVRRRHAEKVRAGAIFTWPLKRACYRSRFESQWRGAAALQAAWRRLGLRNQHVQAAESAAVLQSWVRELMSRQRFGTVLEKSNILQTSCRGRLAQRAWMARGLGTSVIQRMCKQGAARVRFRALVSAALVAQAVLRRVLVKDVMHNFAATETVIARVRAGVARNAWVDLVSALPRLGADLKRVVARESYCETLAAGRVLCNAYERSRDMEEYINEMSDLIAEERAEAERQRKQEEAEEKRRRDEEAADKLGAEYLAKMIAAEQERIQDEKAKLERQKTTMQKMLDFSKRNSPMSSPSNRSPLRSVDVKEPRSPHRRRHKVVESHKQAFIEAVRLEQQGLWPAAIQAFTKVEHVPAFRMMCLCKRAHCLSKLGMRRDAEADLSAAIREYEDDVGPFFSRALLRVQWGAAQEALEDLHNTLQRNPQHLASLVLRANLLFSLARFSDAALDCTRILHLHQEDIRQLLLRGTCTRELGKHRRAVDDFEKAVKLVISKMQAVAEADRKEKEAQKAARPSSKGVRPSSKKGGKTEHHKPGAEPSAAEPQKPKQHDIGWEVLTKEILVGLSESAIADGQAARAEAILTELFEANKDGELQPLTLALRGRVRCFTGRFQAAEADLEDATKLDPENSSVLLYRALFYRRSNLPLALKEIKTAVELDPDNYAAQLAKGKLLETVKDSPGALEAFAAATPEKGAVGLEAKLRTGELMLKLGNGKEEDVEKAWAMLRDAARVHAPDPAVWAHLARLQEVSWRPKEALRAVCKAIHVRPGDEALYALRSRLQEALGRKEPTLRDWWAGLECKPSATVADTKQKALIMMRLGRSARAVESLTRAMAENPADPELKVLLGRALHEVGDAAAAKVRFDEAVLSDPSSEELRGARGLFLQKLCKHKEAKEDLDIALGKRPDQLDWRAARAAVLRELDLLDSAIQDADVVLAGRPNALKTRLLRGMMHEKQRDYTAAITDYDCAVASLEAQPRASNHVSMLDPSLDAAEQRAMRVEASLKRGMLHSQRRSYGAAIEDYNLVLSLQPRCVLAMLHRGIAFHSHGYHSSAISDYNKCLELQPGLLAALQNRATALMALNRHAEALADLDSVPSEKRDAAHWLLVATCLRQFHRYPEALQAAGTSVAIENSLQAQLLYADLQAVVDPHCAASLRLYQRAVRAFPSSRLARFKLALALLKHGHPDAAAEQVQAGRLLCAELWRGDEGGGAEELDALLLLEDGNAAQAVNRMDVVLRNYRERNGDAEGLAGLLALRGVVLERMEDRVAARRDYQQAVRLDERCEEGWYNLGCLLLAEQEWRAAKDAFDKALLLRADNELALLNRSVALYHLLCPAESLRDLDRVLALKPTMGHALLNRGVILNELGRKAEAESDLSAAVELLGASAATITARLKLFVGNKNHEKALRDVAVLLELEEGPAVPDEAPATSPS